MATTSTDEVAEAARHIARLWGTDSPYGDLAAFTAAEREAHGLLARYPREALLRRLAGLMPTCGIGAALIYSAVERA